MEIISVLLGEHYTATKPATEALFFSDCCQDALAHCKMFGRRGKTKATWAGQAGLKNPRTLKTHFIICRWSHSLRGDDWRVDSQSRGLCAVDLKFCLTLMAAKHMSKLTSKHLHCCCRIYGERMPWYASYIYCGLHVSWLMDHVYRNFSGRMCARDLRKILPLQSSIKCSLCEMEQPDCFLFSSENCAINIYLII